MACCNQRDLTWGLYGNPRQWATIYCAYCRHVYRRDVPAMQAKLARDELVAELEQGQNNPFVNPELYVALEELLPTGQGGLE